MSENVRKRWPAEAVLALAIGHATPEVARKAGVNERTVRRWLQNPDLHAEVVKVRRDMMDRALGTLVFGMQRAAATLVQVCQDGTDSARVAAARAILDGAGVLREQLELEDTVAALEKALQERSKPRPRTPPQLRVVPDDATGNGHGRGA